MSAPRKLLALRRDERGMGLPEIIVAMALLTVLMTLVLTAVVSFSRVMTKDSAANDSTNVAAIGMNELTRVIRAGTTVPVPASTTPLPVFTAAGHESVTLHAFIDTDSSTPKPVKVQFSVHPTTRDLVETRWDSYPTPSRPTYWSFHTTPSYERVVARMIVAPAAGERVLFSYYRINDTTKAEEQITLPASGVMSADDRARIVSVEVTLKVQADITSRADPVTMVNRVGIPNLGVSRLGIT